MRNRLGTITISCILAAGLACSEKTSAKIDWIAYEDKILEEAQQAGRPVIVEFSADWCAPCEELERLTFSDENVIEATAPFVTVKADVTDYESPESERLRARFGVTGVPEIVFLNGRGEEIEIARVIGFVGPADFLRRLQFALAASNGFRPSRAGD